MSPLEATIRRSETEPPLVQTLFEPNSFKSVDAALRSIFPTQEEETKAQKARSILQEVAADLSDEEIEIVTAELEWLIGSFLDEFEQEAFNGLTLKEVLRGA